MTPVDGKPPAARARSKVLLELRPALDGHAGIPQEARLLFRGLSTLDGIAVEGLIQSSNRVLSPGLPEHAERWSEDRRVNALSRVVVSLQASNKPGRSERVLQAMRVVWHPLRMMLRTLAGLKTRLGRFEAGRFEDFVWRAMFSRTLPSSDFDVVVRAGFRVARVPWSAAHLAALLVRFPFGAVYPRLDTRGYDVMIAETPYPGRVTSGTRLVVRYHDAIPLLMPHTISDRAYHQASHFHALKRNVRDGAWFCCVSEATRRDLLSIFPQAAPRTVVIHNMVSHHYFVEDSSASRVAEVINMRRSASVRGGGGRRIDPAAGPPEYLLMVSTIEPRKNHSTLLSAWEQLRAEVRPDLHLVLVGALGWEHKAIVRRLRPWLDRGGLHLLEDVPAAELRLLYRHASITVCPSFGEGFDFSGVEAMRCGGVVAASDIPVHRDVFADACELFSPYSAGDIARVLRSLLPGEATAARREALSRAGEVVSARYLPQNLLPQWAAFLERVGTTP
jgi:glycosyltransferase involved in cell wall biosynthesis